ncbi:hypothetical protein Afil01_08960 [Actinorhabdospora filicis]|uniref:Uncharacterized protein n=1 Tax=Actinorhabdospora filicis TaxID=1785913 RepID=A0A9W6SIF5_9ACTN|nr:hypothetical protein Afil01_08960 [Actinorhabdospora filicis]
MKGRDPGRWDALAWTTRTPRPLAKFALKAAAFGQKLRGRLSAQLGLPDRVPELSELSKLVDDRRIIGWRHRGQSIGLRAHSL